MVPNTLSDVTDRPVMLALSTFRQSDELIEHTLCRAHRDKRPLVVVYVVDVNLARYFIGVDLPVGIALRERCEKDLLAEYRQKAEATAAQIEMAAADLGVSCKTSVVVGRFGVEVLKLARCCRPALITLTRSERPVWVRRFFGSPVDDIIEGAGCQVVEDYRDT